MMMMIMMMMMMMMMMIHGIHEISQTSKFCELFECLFIHGKSLVRFVFDSSFLLAISRFYRFVILSVKFS